MILARLNLCQQRRQRRFGCMLPTVSIFRGQAEAATLIDVSEGGGRLVMRTRLAVGSVVRLHYRPDARGAASAAVTARVVWSSRHRDYCEAGLTWCNQGWIPDMLQRLGRGAYFDGRRTRRFEVDFSVSLVLPSIEARGQVTDISYGGAAVQSTTKLTLESPVRLKIQGLDLRSKVVRCMAPADRSMHGVGVAFDGLSNADIVGLSHLLGSLRPCGRRSPLIDKRLLR